MKETKIYLYQTAVWFNGETHWNHYKFFRNKYRSELSKAKNNFINNKINNYLDQKSMWKAIKSLVLRNDTLKTQEIQLNGKSISDKQQIANELNLFFVTSVIQIADGIPFINYENIIDENPCLNFKFTKIDMNIL